MFSYFWPLAVIVLSNTIYQICAKGIPPQMNTYASMTVTYGVATLFSLAAYLVTSKGGNIFKEMALANMATVVLGIVITGLEVGFIFAYKAGWKVSTLSTVANGLLALAVIFLGFFLYHEKIDLNKVIGICLCLAGLFFINK
ncbi:MAG: EamA family transporter [Treponema sp.]|nr:EamA family transporter [Treponema sp.]